MNSIQRIVIVLIIGLPILFWQPMKSQIIPSLAKPARYQMLGNQGKKWITRFKNVLTFFIFVCIFIDGRDEISQKILTNSEFLMKLHEAAQRSNGICYQIGHLSDGLPMVSNHKKTFDLKN